MQVDPGQDELARRRIVSADSCGSVHIAARTMVTVIRLVHVPEKNKVEGLHDRGETNAG
jgi:hypothetical protein